MLTTILIHVLAITYSGYLVTKNTNLTYMKQITFSLFSISLLYLVISTKEFLTFFNSSFIISKNSILIDFLTTLLFIYFYIKLEYKSRESVFFLLTMYLGAIFQHMSNHQILNLLFLEIMSYSMLFLSSQELKKQEYSNLILNYFQIAGLSAGFYQLGCQILYSNVGTLNIIDQIDIINISESQNELYNIIATIFLLMPILLKLGAFPFHNIILNFYTVLNPHYFFLFLQSTKMSLFYLITCQSFMNYPTLFVIALINILYGSIVLIHQYNWKGFLVFSGIVNIGMLFQLICSTQYLIHYQFIYILTQIGLYEILQSENIEYDSQLKKLFNLKSQFWKILIIWLSLAGIPWFAGFWIKLLQFGSQIFSYFDYYTSIILIIQMSLIPTYAYISIQFRDLKDRHIRDFNLQQFPLSLSIKETVQSKQIPLIQLQYPFGLLQSISIVLEYFF